ncbi:MAG: MFS transporter [Desulfotignum sp.]|nr:MFS transporter [Desulfotignum sp.]
MVLFSCLGLGRFALGMLLPSMGISLDLTYSQMGLIGTGNFAGYMASVILAGIVARAIGARKTIAAGLVLVGGSVIWMSQAAGFIQVLMLYTATGIGSGLANVPMMGLVSHWFNKDTRGRAAGTMLSGNGMAIVSAGLLIPWINANMGPGGWRASWLVIGILSLCIAGICAMLLRNDPKEMGLSPMGQPDPGPAAPADAADSPSGRSGVTTNPHKWTMVHLGCIYAFFGATYVVYATFIVTSLVDERGFGEGTAGTFWAVVGALSIFSGPLFGWLSDRLGRKITIIGVYILFTLSYALAGADLPNGFLYASIGIFGLAVWSIPTIMSAAVGDYMGPSHAVRAFGFITLFFGAGQIAGPALAGILADAFGSFSPAFYLCAFLTACGAALTFFLKR